MHVPIAFKPDYVLDVAGRNGIGEKEKPHCVN